MNIVLFTLKMRSIHIFAVLLLLTIFTKVSGGRKPLNSFIRHHERLSYDTEDVHRRMKRAIELSPHANIHIRFKAHNRNFTLHTVRNHFIFSNDFKIVDGFGKNIPYDYCLLYTSPSPRDS